MSLEKPILNKEEHSVPSTTAEGSSVGNSRVNNPSANKMHLIYFLS
jgi:hypothetical protein